MKKDIDLYLEESKGRRNMKPQPPTGAFVGASWAALLVGAITYLVRPMER